MRESSKGGENPKNLVQSIAKAFSVLRAFGPEVPDLTISELAARTGLDRGTCFRLLHTLRDLGYVASVPDSRRFRLTLKCLDLGYATLAHSRLRDVARPLLIELLSDVADAASLGMLDGPDVVYVERVQRQGYGRAADRRIGSRTGIYAAALGQAILAYEAPEIQRAVLDRSERVKLSEKTVIDVDELLRRLAMFREQGWALADGENAYGLRTVAAPIFDQDGAAFAAISATVRAEGQDLETFTAQAVPRVLSVASELTEAVRLSFGEIARQERQR